MEDERDGGRTDIYAPDSDWDSDLSTLKTYTIYDGIQIQIAVNDWIDVMEMVLPLDPMWGSSYQVYSTESDSEIQIRLYNLASDLFEITTISPEFIYNSFRKVQAVE